MIFLVPTCSDGLKTAGWSQFGGGGGACCDSDWESWVKRQRNALTLRPCERALWQTTIKSPIVAANVKLIGRTLREEPPSSRDSFVFKSHSWFLVRSALAVAAPIAFNSALPKATQTLWGRAILKLAWKRWLAWCLCQMLRIKRG